MPANFSNEKRKSEDHSSIDSIVKKFAIAMSNTDNKENGTSRATGSDQEGSMTGENYPGIFRPDQDGDSDSDSEAENGRDVYANPIAGSSGSSGVSNEMREETEETEENSRQDEDRAANQNPSTSRQGRGRRNGASRRSNNRVVPYSRPSFATRRRGGLARTGRRNGPRIAGPEENANRNNRNRNDDPIHSIELEFVISKISNLKMLLLILVDGVEAFLERCRQIANA